MGTVASWKESALCKKTGATQIQLNVPCRMARTSFFKGAFLCKIFLYFKHRKID